MNESDSNAGLKFSKFDSQIWPRLKKFEILAPRWALISGTQDSNLAQFLRFGSAVEMLLESRMYEGQKNVQGGLAPSVQV